jgi:hypothetical protein
MGCTLGQSFQLLAGDQSVVPKNSPIFRSIKVQDSFLFEQLLAPKERKTLVFDGCFLGS